MKIFDINPFHPDQSYTTRSRVFSEINYVMKGNSLLVSQPTIKSLCNTVAELKLRNPFKIKVVCHN